MRAIYVYKTNLVRRRQPKVSFSQLTSAKILAQRSAVPAVATHYTSSTTLKRKKLSHEEKDRLLRIGKRPRRGPLSSIVDSTEAGQGSALMEVTEAVKNSGTYDVWQGDDNEVEDAIVSTKKPAVKVSNPGRFYSLHMLTRHAMKPPPLSHPREHITLSAVPSPHEGTSYNPPATAHEELLQTAHEREEQRVRKAEELAKTKEKIVQARHDALADANVGVPAGMTVQELEDEEETEDAQEGLLPAKKLSKRKTKKERRKAEKRLAEVCSMPSMRSLVLKASLCIPI